MTTATTGPMELRGSTPIGGLVSAITGSAGTAAGSGGDLAGGSGNLNPLSGSSDLPTLSSDPLFGSAAFPSSAGFNPLGGSAALPPLSANFPDGSTEGIGGSAENIGTGVSGSLTNGSAGDITGPLGGSIDSGGSLEPVIGSVVAGDVTENIAGSIGNLSDSLSDPDTGLLGSLTGNGGSTGGSADVLTGSFGDLTEVNGSLTSLTGSIENAFDMSTASTNLGSRDGAMSSLETVSSVEASVGGLLPILSLGGAAALGGAAVGAAAGANVQLPPLPGFPLCDLPQAQIDQLAGLGSVDAQNCPRP
ncbi:hypothetical protein [Dietzia cinnamea]|nr:hypothetical protein [Dietzia cinnamea]MCT2303271.1 hypothetical protein [Dietzia cinnamea]